MVFVTRKRNVTLIAFIFVCSLLIFSLNIENHFTGVKVSGRPGNHTILLDPGHGGEDPGATCEFNGAKEKDINLNIALDLREKLEQAGYQVLMTREKDKLNYSEGLTNVVKKRAEDLMNRKKMMDECGADVVLSIHLNKYAGKSTGPVKGAQVFYPPDKEDCKLFAEALQSSIKQNLDSNNTRVALEKKVVGKPIIIFDNPKSVIAIVECGFLSDQDEAALLVQEDYQKKIADALKIGIDHYFSPGNEPGGSGAAKESGSPEGAESALTAAPANQANPGGTSVPRVSNTPGIKETSKPSATPKPTSTVNSKNTTAPAKAAASKLPA